MTVVRVLRGDANVAAATRRRVEEAARALGYQANPLVSTVMSAMRRDDHRSSYRGTLALLLPMKAQTGPETLHERFLKGARRQAEMIGFKLQEVRLDPARMSARRLQQTLETQGVRGLLLAGGTDVFPADFAFDWSRFALCGFDHNPGTLPMHRVASHHTHNVRLIFQELARRGYRRPGLIMTGDNHRGTDALISMALAEVQLPQPVRERVPPLIVPGWELPELRAWMTRHRPDVILTFRHSMPKYFAQLGLAAPGDVGLVNLSWGANMLGIAGVDWQPELLGAVALDVLVEQILLAKLGSPEVPRTILVDGRWVEGATLRPVLG